jgi:DNA modification methylase
LPNQQPAISSVQQRLEIVYRLLESLKPNPKNPRAHSPKQLKQIANSMSTFGFNVPILIDSDNKIIAGHGRAEASKLRGITEVPTIRLEHLTEAQARAFMIADNRLTENSEWNERLLGKELKELSELDLDFSLELTGFEMGQIDVFIESLDSTIEKDDPADNIPASGKVQVSRPTDIWLLGKHRVYCGSALEQSSYDALLQSERAALVFTDPPYNVPIEHHASGKGEIKHSNFLMASGEMSEVEFTAFLARACELQSKYSVEGSIHYICMDWRHVGELLAAGKKAYAELKNLCVWSKDRGGMGSLYRSQHELVFVFKNGVAPHRNNIQLGQFGRTRSNIWQYPSVNSFGRSGEEGNLLALHPTVKPVALVADAILDCSARGDIVLDPFLGSGTTIIAAERSGRICCGLELDPMYVDTIVRRWQAFTAKSAVHAVSGKTFCEIEEESDHER